jgi:site-specific DNA recombinase
MKARSPGVMHSRFVTSRVLLGGICFCGLCGGAMTLRTGKNGAYRYYTCSTKARMGKAGCVGITIPMDRLDDAVVGHLERKLLQTDRLCMLMGMPPPHDPAAGKKQCRSNGRLGCSPPSGQLFAIVRSP